MAETFEFPLAERGCGCGNFGAQFIFFRGPGWIRGATGAAIEFPFRLR